MDSRDGILKRGRGRFANFQPYRRKPDGENDDCKHLIEYSVIQIHQINNDTDTGQSP
jgi:hypothetical protein